MNKKLKKLFIPAAVLLLSTALLFTVIYVAVTETMPRYLDTIGDVNYNEKITGLYLVKQSAAQDDNVIIYGSSELKTTDIFTQPANFFAGKRAGFQVNLVGRGSCQSLIHAISIAATGDALTGKKVVLITSPQAYIKEGITPDKFMANFSKQQYLELMNAPDISPKIKTYISERVQQLFAQYDALPDTNTQPHSDTYIRYLAEYGANKTIVSSARNAALAPYYAFSRYLFDLKDKTTSRTLLNAPPEQPLQPQSDKTGEINWAEEERNAIADAAKMSDNNDFGMMNGYYTTNVGSRLSRQRGKEKDLDYSVSPEYDDLRILFEICREKGIEPLFVHVPLNGKWSDFTGFTKERRQQYYENVNAIAAEYNIKVLDLTGNEYDEYFLCDVMHLGWKGWLEVDRAIVDFYNES